MCVPDKRNLRNYYDCDHCCCYDYYHYWHLLGTATNRRVCDQACSATRTSSTSYKHTSTFGLETLAGSQHEGRLPWGSK